MVIEVYSGAKPARASRAWLASIALLMVASGLAASMTWRRSSRLLATRVEPAGWEITFQPPRPFESTGRGTSGPAEAYRYRLSGEGGASAQLAVWRLHASEGVTAAGVCELILQQAEVSWLRSLLGPPPTRFEDTIGNRTAIEIQDPATQMAVRAVVLESGVAYAVSLRVQGAAIDEGVYRFFDLTCRSVEFKAD